MRDALLYSQIRGVSRVWEVLISVNIFRNVTNLPENGDFFVIIDTYKSILKW